jgi:hypothetical protein
MAWVLFLSDYFSGGFSLLALRSSAWTGFFTEPAVRNKNGDATATRPMTVTTKAPPIASIPLAGAEFG